MELYYALWAQLAGLPVFLRAALVVGICFLLCTLFLELVGLRILSFCMQIMIWIIQLLFSSGFESVPYKSQQQGNEGMESFLQPGRKILLFPGQTEV